MPEIAFMEVSNDIKGESNVKDQSDKIEVLSFSHEVSKEVDPLDCRRVRGDRRHHVFEVVKSYDKATPMLAQFLCQGKKIDTVTIRWFRADPDGGDKPQHYFTHTFTDCIVTSVRPWMPNALDSSTRNFGHMEAVTFGYGQISWKSETGGTEFKDDVRG